MRYAESPHEPRIADVTFGPLGKYRPANDNFAGVKRYGEEGGFVGNHNHDAASAPVAKQPARTPSTDSGQFRGDNPHMEMTPEERLPSGLQRCYPSSSAMVLWRG